MRYVLTGLAVLAISAAAPAVAAQQGQAPAQPQAATQSNAPDQVICEREQDTGSRLTARKVCHTRSQWAQIQRDDRQMTEQTQRNRPMETGN